MSPASITCANKQWGGYPANVAARVSRRRAAPAWPEKTGSATPDRAASIAPGLGHRLTHFCGFAVGAGAIVGLFQLVQFPQGLGFASIKLASPLMGNLQRAGKLCTAGGVPSTLASPTGGVGATPLARARPLYPLSRSCDLEFSKKFTAAQVAHRLSRIALWLPQRDLADGRKVQSVQAGSGVRVARDAAVTGRLARRPKGFRDFGIVWFRVQRAISLAIGVTGTGKLCLQIGNVN